MKGWSFFVLQDEDGLHRGAFRVYIGGFIAPWPWGVAATKKAAKKNLAVAEKTFPFQKKETLGLQKKSGPCPGYF